MKLLDTIYTAVRDTAGPSEPEETVQRLCTSLYNKLELAVGARIAGRMTNQQLDELEQLMDADADQTTCLAFLGRNVPDYQQIIEAELTEILAWFVSQANNLRPLSACPTR